MALLRYFCVALLAAPAWAAMPPLQEMKKADEIYQERLENYLATVPRTIAEEARMSVVSIEKFLFLTKKTYLSANLFLSIFFLNIWNSYTIIL